MQHALTSSYSTVYGWRIFKQYIGRPCVKMEKIQTTSAITTSSHWLSTSARTRFPEIKRLLTFFLPLGQLKKLPVEIGVVRESAAAASFPVAPAGSCRISTPPRPPRDALSGIGSMLNGT